jgi:uncharacterized NAD(P)/FAD-binding protein YdhS
MDHLYSVVVIGSGFSGTLTAVQLLRHLPQGHSVALVERSDTFGRGVAYGTTCSRHLLNVPAGKMSALPDSPDHFLEWVRANRLPTATAGDFLPRKLYGDYCQSLLATTVRETPEVTFDAVNGEAVSIRKSGAQWEVILENGERLRTCHVILATGNQPPAPFLELEPLPDTLYKRDPWAGDTLQDVPLDGSILLLGSGLTAVDQVLTLQEQRFTGTVWMISRRGLLPNAHKASAAWPSAWTEPLPCSLLSLLTSVREQIEIAAEQGSDWRAVIDSLRPHSQRIWRSLPPAEKRRFMRHVRPYWEVHRHRVAPEVYGVLAEWMKSGRLKVIAGRIQSSEALPGKAKVIYRERNAGQMAEMTVDRVVNCTGPNSTLAIAETPLLHFMLQQGLCRFDPLRFGIDTDESGALIDGEGVVSDSLFALGPLRKGQLWETTAVPEIRVQAAMLAEHIALSCAERASQVA